MSGRSVLTLAVALLVVPVFARAVDFQFVPATKVSGKVTLQAKPNNIAVKGAVNVAPETPITLVWTIPSGYKGCWSNWSSTPISTSGFVTGTIPSIYTKGGSFVLTCSGVGVAQTASVSVSVSKPNLTTATPTISGTVVGGKYMLAPVPFTLKYSVRNSSKVVASGDLDSISVVLQKKVTEAGAATVIKKEEVSSLAPNASKVFTFDDVARTASGFPSFYRVCVDYNQSGGTGVIDESKENDNCSAFTRGVLFGNSQ